MIDLTFFYREKGLGPQVLFTSIFTIDGLRYIEQSVESNQRGVLG